jgi:hypothetical protein
VRDSLDREKMRLGPEALAGIKGMQARVNSRLSKAPS